MGFSSSCVFPCCCALSPAENRPVCQTHALYGNREMWASGERCSYFKRKSSLLLSERFFHPWYGHTGAFPLLWQKMWSRVVLYVYAFDILSANQCICTERPSLKLFLNREAVLFQSLDSFLPKMKILSSFTHPLVVLCLPWYTKRKKTYSLYLQLTIIKVVTKVGMLQNTHTKTWLIFY